MLFLYNFTIYFFIFATGIVIGSFLNVCILRLPKHESIATTPSHCFSCNTKIKRYDLIPVLSWLILKGRCRHCGEKISARYPVVELLNGLLWIFAYYILGAQIKTIIVCLMISALIIVAFMDWDTLEINVGVITFIALLAIPSYFFTSDADLVSRLIGAVIISVPFFIIGTITGGIGFGDVLLMGAAGLLLGVPKILVATFIGLILASIVGIIIKVITKNSRFAFGPWLAIAIAFSSLYGDRISKWYLSLIGF